METTLYFDLGSPYAYLTAERIEAMFAGPIDWQPISLGALFKLNGRSSWSLAGAEHRRDGIARALAGPVAGQLLGGDARRDIRKASGQRARVRPGGVPRGFP
jgi:hypothetical protein